MAMRSLRRSIAQHMAKLLIGTGTAPQVTLGGHVPEDMWRAFHAGDRLDLFCDRVGKAIFAPHAAAIVAREERAVVGMRNNGPINIEVLTNEPSARFRQAAGDGTITVLCRSFAPIGADAGQ